MDIQGSHFQVSLVHPCSMGTDTGTAKKTFRCDSGLVANKCQANPHLLRFAIQGYWQGVDVEVPDHKKVGDTEMEGPMGPLESVRDGQK